MTEVGLERAYEVLRGSEIKPGRKLFWGGKRLTSELLRAEIECAILRAGGTPMNTIIAGGDQACDPHDRGSGALAANSLIILDVFPRAADTGYYGDVTRTVVRGRASEAQKRLWHTVLEGQEYALRRFAQGYLDKSSRRRFLIYLLSADFRPRSAMDAGLAFSMALAMASVWRFMNRRGSPPRNSKKGKSSRWSPASIFECRWCAARGRWSRYRERLQSVVEVSQSA